MRGCWCNRFTHCSKYHYRFSIRFRLIRANRFAVGCININQTSYVCMKPYHGYCHLGNQKSIEHNLYGNFKEKSTLDCVEYWNKEPGSCSSPTPLGIMSQYNKHPQPRKVPPLTSTTLSTRYGLNGLFHSRCTLDLETLNKKQNHILSIVHYLPPVRYCLHLFI